MTDSTRFAWRRMVVRDPHLTDATRRVLLELESYANPDGSNARPGVQRIAEQLGSGDRHVSEKTVRRALANGVERGFIQCVSKGHGGRGHSAADVYRLVLAPVSVDTQMSGETPAISGHPDVHRNENLSGHSEDFSGHLAPISGHPDVHLPVHYTSSLTPDHSPHLSNAHPRDQSRNSPREGTEISEPTPSGRFLAGPQSPIEWIEEAVHGLSAEELELACQLIDEHGTNKYATAQRIRDDREQKRARRLVGTQKGTQ
ncbi:helix-turn-helix domain-containing protein [Rhodococcus sp. G-MC3]|uniref:helix-turn-helix domain-containing protein n=1 Tax=Rhodococcus sp. G-MC3 TaxID=3046209 RepID=UPI003FA6CCD7